jgi:hypothetical protein
MGASSIRKSKKVGRYQLIFQEEVVENASADLDVNGFSSVLEGLLDYQHPLNPYEGFACAKCKRYIFMTKPERLFNFQNAKYALAISSDYYREICSFIREYTHINFLNNPMGLGDVYCFTSEVKEFHGNKGAGIIVYPGPHNYDFFLVRFKNNAIIVHTRVIDAAQCVGEQIIVDCSSDWTSQDIEFYKGENLIFVARDIVYMGQLHFSLTMNTDMYKSNIPFNKLEIKYSTKRSSKPIVTEFGLPISYEKKILEASESSINSNLRMDRPSADFLFIKPNEMKKVMTFIQNAISKDCRELWLFDSYFSDRG